MPAIFALPASRPSSSACRTRRLRRPLSSQYWRKAQPGKTNPRVPAGQSGGGQWTNGDAGGAPPTVDDGVYRPGANDPHNTQRGGSEENDTSGRAPPTVDDGVYRPGTNDPHIILTGGAEEDDAARRSNGPPDDYTRLEDVFPGLKDKPALAIPLAPIDGFFGVGVGAAADEANLEATLGQYRALVAEIKQVDPTFADSELLPAGGIDSLDWQGRTNLINNLRMERAAADYRMRGDVGPLQVETLRFLQDAVDDAYEKAATASDAGRLEPRLSRAEAIGNSVDFEVRQALMNLFGNWGRIPASAGL